MSTIRTKKKTEAQAKGFKRRCIKILVENLRVGDELVTHFVSTSSKDVDDVLDFLEGRESRYALKTSKVTKINICEGQWRTHIHVNGMDCYDIRTYVWIAA